MSKSNTNKISSRFSYAIVFLISFLVYFNTLQHDFALDDDVVYLKNSFVQNGVSSIPDILSHGFLYGFNQKNDQSYRPIVLIHYAIENSIFGNNPKALHFLNVFYYSLLGMLLFYFLKSIFLKEKDSILLLFVCLVFVVHPIHTEVVANIKGRDEIFHALFSLLSLVFVLKYIDKSNLKYMYFSLGTFFLALLSKEMAITLLAIVPLTIYFFREVKTKKILQTSMGFILVAVFYFILRNNILDTIAFDEKMTVINNGIVAAPNFSSRLATTFYIFGDYLKLLFFPLQLSWDYSYPHFPIVGFNNIQVIIVLLLSIVATILSFLALSKKSIFAYSWLFFICSFSIVSNFFILIGATLGERFLFFPSIAVAIALFALAKQLAKKIDPKYFQLALLIFIVFYSLKTVSRNKDWKNNHALFEAGAEVTPNNTRAISALATVYREKGEQTNNVNLKREYFNKAVNYYKRSIELYRDNSDSWYNLGVTYMNQGNDQAAKTTFTTLLQFNPSNLNALNNLGVINFREQNYSEAERLYLKCLEYNSNFQSAYANLGAIYHNQGNLQKAEQYYLRALQLNPKDGNTQRNFSQLKSQLNK
jgi:tetratricopeptide (TPR) repeat protein